MSRSARSIAAALMAAGFAASSSGCAAVPAAVGTTLEQVVPKDPVAVAQMYDELRVSDDEERRLGQAMARAIEDSVPIWDDPMVQDYMTNLLHRLVAVAEPRPFEYRIRLLKVPEVNAFAVPGGHIYFNAGLIARMENEAQLATVLGHEIAHVTERHSVRGAQQAFGAQMLSRLAANLSLESGVLEGEALAMTHRYATLASVNGLGRAQESEADEVGLRYLVDAGYDPRQAPHTFRQILELYGDPGRVQHFFYGSHPRNQERIGRLGRLVEERYAEAAAERGRIVNTEEFQRVSRHIVIAVGVLDYEEKRYETARALFEKALRVSEDDPVPHYYLGLILLETRPPEELDEAIEYLRTAVQIDPTLIEPHRELGRAHYRAGDFERAIPPLERYLELAPDADDADEIREMVRRLNRLIGA